MEEEEDKKQSVTSAPSLPEGWSREHHLVGQVTSISFLRPDESQRFYYQTEESVKIVGFQPEKPSERKPALWRNLVEAGGKAMAIDYVAADMQDGTTKSLLHATNVQLAQERIEAAVLERVYSEVLPELVLVAALEELRSQFLKLTDRHNQKGQVSTTAVDSPPAYYSMHPNQYVKAPAPKKEVKEEDDTPTSASFSFTPNQLVIRIKSGCQLAFSSIESSRQFVTPSICASERRASSRIAKLAEQQFQNDTSLPEDDEVYNYWKVTTGGNVATFIMEHYAKNSTYEKDQNYMGEKRTLEKDDGDDDNGHHDVKVNDEEEEGEIENEGEAEVEDGEADDEGINTYLIPTGDAIVEWLGRKTAKLLSAGDLQKSFPSLVYQTEKKGKKKKKLNVRDLGKKALQIMSSTDITVWKEAMETTSDIGENARLCLQSLTYDDTTELEDWETTQFGRSAFFLQLLDDGQDEKINHSSTITDDVDMVKYREEKAWSLWRYKGIHGGYTFWPSWKAAVEEWRKSVFINQPPARDITEKEGNGATMGFDQDTTQAMAQEDMGFSSGRRATRRGGETGAVFYGNQSTMSLKQLMDALLRITSLKPYATLLDLLATVQDDSTDPFRRLRNALGRIVYKRNQLAVARVETTRTDTECLELLTSPKPIPVLAPDDSIEEEEKDVSALASYLKELLTTELLLRRLVIKHLTDIPVDVIATAADERVGSMESTDEVDFENPENFEWLSSGQELLGKYIFRPVETTPVDGPSSCFWFRVVSFVPSIQVAADQGMNMFDKPSLGLAKDTVSVERRIRFRAVPAQPPGQESSALSPSENLLILTEGQVRAGIKAADVHTKLSRPPNLSENPMIGRTGANISLVPVDGNRDHMTGTVAAHSSTLSTEGVLEHKILFMPDLGPKGSKSLWILLKGETGGLHGRVQGDDDVLYAIQEFDYDSSSPAFKECKAVLALIQRHGKAGPFLHPVDPIALNIPTYFQVVKRPMDLSTVAKKLENGDYSRFSLSETIGSTPIARMLNGPFRSDIELIFDNATLFNPPDDWIHRSAITLKKFAQKKIEQASQKVEELEFSRGVKIRKSVYIEYDSDTDMYGYEDEKDEDYDGADSTRKRRRAEPTRTKEDPCVKAIERVLPLYKVLPDGATLRGPFGNLPLSCEASSFSLPMDWTCRRWSPPKLALKPTSQNPVSAEIEDLIELRSHMEDQSTSSLRRSTRAVVYESMSGKSTEQRELEGIAFDHAWLHKLGSPPPTSRADVEIVRERLHEEYFAKTLKLVGTRLDLASYFLLRDSHTVKVGQFSDFSFPPYLGCFLPSTTDGAGLWEIRTPFVVPALRWVIRGLIASEHLGEVESLTDENLRSGVILINNAYYYDDTLCPFDVVDQKEFSRRKKLKQDEGDNDADEADRLELSEYERLRQDRVARNAERLRALGLA